MTRVPIELMAEVSTRQIRPSGSSTTLPGWMSPRTPRRRRRNRARRRAGACARRGGRLSPAAHRRSSPPRTPRPARSPRTAPRPAGWKCKRQGRSARRSRPGSPARIRCPLDLVAQVQLVHRVVLDVIEDAHRVEDLAQLRVDEDRGPQQATQRCDVREERLLEVPLDHLHDHGTAVGQTRGWTCPTEAEASGVRSRSRARSCQPGATERAAAAGRCSPRAASGCADRAAPGDDRRARRESRCAGRSAGRS